MATSIKKGKKTEPTDIILSLDSDKFFIVKGAIITEWDFALERDVIEIPQYGQSQFRKRGGMLNISGGLKFVGTEVEQYLGESLDKKIKWNRVVDCSVRELMFAVREKLRIGE